jgi:tetratricopeptide (TPR) repeat protein
LADEKTSFAQLTDQLRTAELAGDPWKQGIALNNLGDLFKSQREHAKALAHFQKALQFFTALDDQEKKAAVLNNLGGTYLDAREYQRALEHFALALGTYGALNQPFGQAMALNNMGGVHLRLGHHAEARKQFILATSFFRSATEPTWEAQALENLAAAEAALGNTKAAGESYARALEIWQHLDQHERQAMILNRIAAMQTDQRRALELHSRALTLAHQTKNAALIAGTRSSLGRLYLEARNFNSARSEFQAALVLYEQFGDKRSQAATLVHLARIDFATGEDLVRTAAEIFRQVGDIAGEQAALELLKPAAEAKQSDAASTQQADLQQPDTPPAEAAKAKPA